MRLNLFIDLIATWGMLQTKQYFKRKWGETGVIFFIAPFDDSVLTNGSLGKCDFVSGVVPWLIPNLGPVYMEGGCPVYPSYPGRANVPYGSLLNALRCSHAS